MVQPQSGLLLSNKKERIIDTQSNADEWQLCHAKSKKQDTDSYVMIPFMEHAKKNKLQGQTAEPGWSGKRTDYKQA